jgi:hypothetical protein
MTQALPPKMSSTRNPSPAVVSLLQTLKPGQRLEITQKVRVGSRVWTTTVAGVYRGLNYLATGLATDRVPEDDIVVPIVHFTKDNGELSSVSLDEHTQIRLAGG